METKFTLGQTIKNINDPASDFGKIIEIHVKEGLETIYTISLKAWDSVKREAVDGVKHIEESLAELKHESKEEGEQNEQTV